MIPLHCRKVPTGVESECNFYGKGYFFSHGFSQFTAPFSLIWSPDGGCTRFMHVVFTPHSVSGRRKNNVTYVMRRRAAVGRKKTENTRRVGTPWRRCWSRRGFTVGQQDAGWRCWTCAVTVRNGPGWRRPTRRNGWVSMNRTGSEGIPLPLSPVKSRHADYCGSAAC